MSWISITGVFVIIWWIALFTLLPLWIKRPEHFQPGIDKAAPENAYITKKMIITTAIAAFATLIITLLYNYGIIGFDFVYNQPDIK